MDCELLAPAGNFETALAAFEAGADAVYCGLADFSARAFATNFSTDDLKNLLRVAHSPRADRAEAKAKKVYITFNTVIDEDSFESAVEQLALLDEIGPDSIIVQDLGVAHICRKYFPRLELHASTQLVAHNLEGVLALKELGFKRVVLARELSLEEISSIAKRCQDVDLEVFVHGALCYSISGMCLFGAMEKGRSGNRGKCPYCCRLPYEDKDGRKTLAFSMKDLRLGENVRKLAEVGVASLKIEGRMKSALYVASVTKYYRQILGMREEGKGKRVEIGDLETVFSRRTTSLYFSHPSSHIPHPLSPLDPTSLGHLGSEIGSIKHITKDREGLSWLRFHTSRALEKHDGLQFEAMVDGRHVGMGIVEMRQAISRRPVFEVNAGTDVEVLLPTEDAIEKGAPDLTNLLKPGMKIYCSMSNAVKRMFPTPSFRPSDYAGGTAIDVEVTLAADRIAASVTSPVSLEVVLPCDLQSAKNPEKTKDGVRKAFSKLGETDYYLRTLTVNDADRLFAPMSILNDLRRDLVEKLDDARADLRHSKIEAALSDNDNSMSSMNPARRLRIRAGQKIPFGDWFEIIVAINADTKQEDLPQASSLRLGLPVYTSELNFQALRRAVKRFVRAGFSAWEASDLATLRLLREVGVTDITADWTLYAFNSYALAELAERGVKRFVASPENNRENLQFLAESGFDIEFLVQQSTPLFISLTKPAAELAELAVFQRDELWVTTKHVPRTFDIPKNVPVRLDLSWDPSLVNSPALVSSF